MFYFILEYSWTSLAAQLVKNPPAKQESWVWSLGWENPLEKRTATHPSILAWRIPWTATMGSQRVQHSWATCTLSWLAMLWQLHVDSKGTQPYTCIIHSPRKRLPSPGCTLLYLKQISHKDLLYSTKARITLLKDTESLLFSPQHTAW